MPSLDFDREQAIFRAYHDSDLPRFKRIMAAAMAALRRVMQEAGVASSSGDRIFNSRTARPAWAGAFPPPTTYHLPPLSPFAVSS